MTSALDAFMQEAGPLIDHLYPVQRRLVMDCIRAHLRQEKHNAIACLVRQVGKSRVDAALLFIFSMLSESREQKCLYVTGAKIDAERIMWATMKEINEEYNLGFKFNAQKLTVTHEHHKGEILLMGFDREDLIDSARGMKYAIVIADEVAFVNQDNLQVFLLEAIKAGRGAYAAPLVLTTTPGRKRKGFTFETLHEAKEGRGTFKNYWWDQYDNIKYPLWRDIKDQEKRRKRVDQFLEDEAEEYPKGKLDPAYRRENKAEWVEDDEDLILRPSATSVISQPPTVDGDWRVCIAIDLGYVDDAAWLVLGYNRYVGVLYQLQEISKSKLGLTEVGELTNNLIDSYKGLVESVVVDTAAGGKGLIHDLQIKYGMWCKQAVKADKDAGFKVVNDLFDRGRLKLLDGSGVLDQAKSVVWNEARTREKEGQKCDLFDCLIYGSRESYAWIEETPPEKKDLSNPEVYIETVWDELERQDIEELMWRAV
jgi:hypothetical protein